MNITRHTTLTFIFCLAFSSSSLAESLSITVAASQSNVTDSITQSNVKVVGEAPSESTANIYQDDGSSLPDDLSETCTSESCLAEQSEEMIAE